ncbi:IST1-like protein [Cucurbita argyrosperma subsp. argyrosperma]|nr:IST1-like protein [Cucurbita argyrosperma subsp. argyrosperma]
MSMLASFFYKGFKAAQCKTLLKLTIPRIKLLRNRREIQLKQMRRDIAKLLETGQEATARIREILELFCELIVVRLPIIETQRECPLDLKEAISSVCFAAPRCADLTELLQLIELLSVRAPSPEKKLKLLKEIAEEHDVDWDPAGTEAEFNKSPEDLLNGSARFVSASKLPLPQEKHNEAYNAPQPDSDSELDMLDFPEVPKISVSPHSTIDPGSASSMIPPPSNGRHRLKLLMIHRSILVFPKTPTRDLQLRRGEVTPFEPEINFTTTSVSRTPDEKFGLKYEQEDNFTPPSGSRTKSDVEFEFAGRLAAAQAAVETARACCCCS